MAPRLIDLFAGCGGMTLGFVRAGFELAGAIEVDRDAGDTYAQNIGDRVHVGPIEDAPPFPPADVVIGGPPCQGFSALNMRRVGLGRRALWRHYLRALEEEGPKVFVMENVPQLLRSAEYELFALAA